MPFQKLFVILSLLMITAAAFGQGRPEREILQEAEKLYRSEMASWYGTDLFLEKFPNYRDSAVGYFSYSENDTTRNIFYLRGEKAKVIVTTSFDTTFDVHTARIDDRQREFTRLERNIYDIREKARAEIVKDTVFKTYENTNFNLIPIVDGNNKRVYILTGPKKNGVVIFGNDYLISFDKKGNVSKVKQLHRNIITINYGDEKLKEVSTIHTHLHETGPIITPTDLCTLMLYGRFTTWEQHYVISDENVSIWDCKKKQLVILSKEAWDRITKDIEERK